MKIGCVRVTSKRKGFVFPPVENEVVIDVDRSNRVMGNPIELKNKYDMAERLDVISKYGEKLNLDFENEGPMYNCILEYVNILLTGRNLSLRCWCNEPDNYIPCHADKIKEKIEEIIEQLNK